MRTLAPLLAVLLCGACLSAEQQPLAWSHDRPVADWISTGLVAANVLTETVVAWRTDDRRHALGCEAVNVGLTVGVAELTKRVIHRTRPDGSDQRSFFSEHTAIASAATGWRLNVSVPIAIGAGYLRGAARKHFSSDIVTGAVIGGLFSRVCR